MIIAKRNVQTSTLEDQIDINNFISSALIEDRVFVLLNLYLKMTFIISKCKLISFQFAAPAYKMFSRFVGTRCKQNSTSRYIASN